MAKKDKDSKKADTKGKSKAAEKDEPETFKYGVQDLADKLDLEPASVRVKLRNAGVEKAGKAYGWNTKAELDEVIDQISSSEKKAKKADTKGKKSKKSDDDEDDEDEAPKSAKKSKKDKGGKKASSKKSKKDDDEDEDDDD